MAVVVQDHQTQLEQSVAIQSEQIEDHQIQLGQADTI